jgi:hypothetical protein
VKDAAEGWGVGQREAVRSVVSGKFLARPCMLVYYTSTSATVPQPGPQATGTSGHCL